MFFLLSSYILQKIAKKLSSSWIKKKCIVSTNLETILYSNPYCSLLFPNWKTYVKRTTEDRRDTIRTEKKYRLNNWKVNIQL